MSKIERPAWQEDRGPRYGNRRKQVAELKRRARRTDRARDKSTNTQHIHDELS